MISKVVVAIVWMHVTLTLACAEPPELRVRIMEADELAKFRRLPTARVRDNSNLTVGYNTDESFTFGDPPLIVSRIARLVLRPKIEETEILDADKNRISTVDWDLESQTGERVIAIDLKSLAIRQVDFAAPSTRGDHFVGCFALYPDLIGVVVRPQGDYDKTGHLESLWTWNLRTNELKLAIVQSRLWTLQSAIDQKVCRIDETELLNGRVTLINQQTAKQKEVTVHESAIGRRPFDIDVAQGEDWFAPTAKSSSVIVVRNNECLLECVDTETDGGSRWQLSKQSITEATGKPYVKIVKVRGAFRPCALLPVFACTTSTSLNHCLWIDTENGKITRVVKLDIDTYSEPVMSADGRWMAFIQHHKGLPRGLRVFDLQSSSPPIDMPYDAKLQTSAADLRVVGVTTSARVQLETRSGFWEVLANSKWPSRKLFELPPTQ